MFPQQEVLHNRLVVSSEALRPQPQNRLRIMNNQELLDAAKDGKVGEVLRILLAGVADINAQVGEYGETPLLAACWQGHLEAAQALLLGNADVDATDRFEYTALHKASEKGHTEIVQLLLQVGANMEAKDFCMRLLCTRLAVEVKWKLSSYYWKKVLIMVLSTIRVPQHCTLHAMARGLTEISARQ